MTTTTTGLTIAFLGLGNMGLPMAQNLQKAGHAVQAFDVFAPARERAAAAGMTVAADLAAALKGTQVLVTMLPSGKETREVYLGDTGVLALAAQGTLLIDGSTIDVATAREVAAEATKRGFTMLDAPVSGGVAAATAGTLTFMVGGTEAGFAQAQPILAKMGKAVVHAGASGAGTAAKICNNMMLGIQMISVCEGFNLAKGLGLAPEKLFEISSQASAQCWSLTSYCPVPGPLPASPANRDYKPGFAAAMMLKDLKLAAEAAGSVNVATPLGLDATALYADFCEQGHGGVDFSGIIRMLAEEDANESRVA